MFSQFTSTVVAVGDDYLKYIIKYNDLFLHDDIF